MTTRTLVAGGSGFLGSHLCERLLVDGHRVYCLDSGSSGRASYVEHPVGDDVYEPLAEDDPKRQCPDSIRARELLEWVPEIEPEDGLRHITESFAETEPNA